MTTASESLRIFVVGAPRSGTTLVQSLLAAHGALTSFTESHFFSRHFRVLPLVGTTVLARDPLPRLLEFLAENGIGAADAAALAGGVRAAVRPGLLRPFRARACAHTFIELLDGLGVRRGARGWIEKTPWHLRFVGFLERLSPPPRPIRFVHVIRDGLEVAASLHAASQNWERHYAPDECARRWNADLLLSVQRLGSPVDHFVLYEELTSDPETVLRKLLAELGLSFEPGIMTRYASAAAGLVTDGETWKAGVGEAIRPSATSGEALTEEQRQRVSQLLRHDLHARLRRATERRGGDDDRLH